MTAPSSSFQPGRPLTSARQRLECGTPYGCAAGDDWVTVIRHRDGTYHWRQIHGAGLGSGMRGQFEAWLAALHGEARAG